MIPFCDFGPARGLQSPWEMKRKAGEKWRSKAQWRNWRKRNKERRRQMGWKRGGGGGGRRKGWSNDYTSCKVPFVHLICWIRSPLTGQSMRTFPEFTTLTFDMEWMIGPTERGRKKVERKSEKRKWWWVSFKNARRCEEKKCMDTRTELQEEKRKDCCVRREREEKNISRSSLGHLNCACWWRGGEKRNSNKRAKMHHEKRSSKSDDVMVHPEGVKWSVRRHSQCNLARWMRKKRTFASC